MIFLATVTACLLIAFVALWRDQAQERKTLLAQAERERHALITAHDRERESHRREIAQLNQARMEETANLLQRIQAPEQAVTSHVADTAPPDPPPLNLENDEELLAEYEQRVQGFLSG